MADVAREAGVSLQTVSRAINNKNEISGETKKKVLEVAKGMGFRPSGIARSLAKQRTTTIGLVVPDIANPFFSEIARGVEDIAYSNAYNVFLFNTDEDIEREKSALDSLLEQQVDGLVLCSSRLDQIDLGERLNEFHYVVLVNREIKPQVSGVRTILVDDVRGARKAVAHLLSSGHNTIAFVAGPKRSRSGRNRLRGYRDGLRMHGLDNDPGLVHHCEPDTVCGKEAARKLLESRPDITAILAYNDLVAVGVLQACKELQRRVPKDVAIIGSDDIPLASFVTPALSTLHIPKREIGAAAMVTLISLMNGNQPTQSTTVFQPELVLRSSAA